MRINSVEIFSYGSIRLSGSIAFSEGLNLIVGQNNAGKSLILSALKYNMANWPHRDETVYEEWKLTQSSCQLSLSLEEDELQQSGVNLREFVVPVPNNLRDYPNYFSELAASNDVKLMISKAPDAIFSPGAVPSLIEGFEAGWGFSQRYRLQQVDGRQILKFVGSEGAADHFPSLVQSIWQQKVFYFAPQRFHLARLPFGRYEILKEDASNLPGVLSLLMTERTTLFRAIVDDMKEIFPSIGNISIINSASGEFEVRIWSTQEISIPQLGNALDLSGTGISQALAILTAAAMTDRSVLLIDEVNTFLHPGAAKALIRVLLSRYPSHQYIVSTHSSEIIGMRLASSIHLAIKDGFQTIVKSVEVDRIEHLAVAAASIGVSAADILGTHRIVWVEGQTEESVFAEILRNTSVSDQLIRFIPVIATGDFDLRNKDKDKVVQIYDRMTKAISPLQGRPVFAFDTEGLSSQEIYDLRKRSQYRMMFLPRRNMESFLLIPSVIAGYFGSLYPEFESVFSEKAVGDKLEELASSQTFEAVAPWSGDLKDESWLALVDGARLLAAVVSALSDHSLEYRKNTHSLGLVGTALRIEPESISGLTKFLEEVVRKANSFDLID